MKRIIAAIALLSVSVTFSFVSNRFIIKKINDFSALSKELVELSKNGYSDELMQKTKIITEEWKNSEWVFHTLATSEYVTEAEESIEILYSLLNQGLEEEFKAKCAEAYNNIQTIKENETITFENIF